jgi:hypothetical protein
VTPRSFLAHHRTAAGFVGGVMTTAVLGSGVALAAIPSSATGSITACVNRTSSAVPLPLQFDVLQDGQVLATVDRVFKLRDVYKMNVNDEAFDWRVAAAVAVAVDAFMNR